MMLHNLVRNFNKYFNKSLLWVLFPVSLFSLIIIPYVNTIPYLDGNIDFIKSIDFYQGGITRLLENWNSVHPPLKEAVNYLFFTINGVNSTSYIIPGIIFGVGGIIFYFFLLNKIFTGRPAKIATLLLATSPFYISIGLFNLTDFIVTNLLIITAYAYLNRKYVLYTIAGSLVVLAKETALVFFISVIIVEFIFFLRTIILRKNKNKDIFAVIVTNLIPFTVIVGWNWYLNLQGKGVWGDWNFSSTADKGTLYTIFNNIVTLELFNKYAFQNWLQLFTLNFNWVYWTFILFGLVISLKHLYSLFQETKQNNKLVLVSLLFFILYLFTVLSFQTYTIPRYNLPLLPVELAFFSFAFSKILEKSKPVFSLFLTTLLIVLVFIQSFFSLDPISKIFWGEERILGENFYALNKHLSGNDGLTYNLQYLNVANKRTRELHSQEKIDKLDCYWLFPDKNNDSITTTILRIKNNPAVINCL